jgi:hypothetical protein
MASSRIGRSGRKLPASALSGDAEKERHAVEQHAGGERAEQEIFHARLVGTPFAFREADEHVERQSHQFKTDVERDQIVTAGEKHHADGGEQNERVILAALLALHVQIAQGDGNGQRGREQKDGLEDEAEAVYPHHAVKSVERQIVAVGLPEQEE